MNIMRALDHDGNDGLFDTPMNAESAASRDYVFNEDHLSTLKPPQLQLEEPPKSADWDTRSTILLAEALVVTIIVGFILIFCLRKHHRKLQQRVGNMNLQEWTTIRIPAHGDSTTRSSQGGARDEGITDIESRVRVDSGISGMISLAQSSILPPGSEIHLQNAATTTNNSPPTNNEEQQVETPRTPMSTLRSIPRTIGSILLYPLRLLESGVNSWSTENYDEIFIRTFMEQLENEREASRENHDDREIRLKEAFVKECMVLVRSLFLFVQVCFVVYFIIQDVCMYIYFYFFCLHVIHFVFYAIETGE